MIYSLIFLWAVVPDSVVPYFEQFKDDYQARLPERIQVTAIIITMEDKMTPGVIGQCFMASNVVRLSTDYWEKADAYERSDLLYHGLGHCLFWMTHSDNPEDIMYYSVAPKSPWYPRVNRFFEVLKHD